jgi:hypothetical protein
MLKILKWSAIVAIFILAAAQFVRPARTNPPVEEVRAARAHLNMPSEVQAVLKRACYDCHSNETSWPWYSNVAPASWFVTDHVDHGRKHLNFSDWAQEGRHTEKKDAGEQLDEIRKEVEARNMPLGSYLLLHPDARLSDRDIKLITDWAVSERQRLAIESREAFNKQ